jgi:hypothetical protein
VINIGETSPPATPTDVLVDRSDLNGPLSARSGVVPPLPNEPPLPARMGHPIPARESLLDPRSPAAQGRRRHRPTERRLRPAPSARSAAHSPWPPGPRSECAGCNVTRPDESTLARSADPGVLVHTAGGVHRRTAVCASGPRPARPPGAGSAGVVVAQTQGRRCSPPAVCTDPPRSVCGPSLRGGAFPATGRSGQSRGRPPRGRRSASSTSATTTSRPGSPASSRPSSPPATTSTARLTQLSGCHTVATHRLQQDGRRRVR